MTKTAGFLLLVLSAGLPAQWIGRPAPAWEKEFQAWVADPHKRIYPGSFGRDLDKRTIELQACRNEHAVIHLGARSPTQVAALSVRASDLRSEDGALLPARSVRIRYPGLMPVDENGHYTPDPLWEIDSIALTPLQSQGIWIDLKIPAAARPGKYEGTLNLTRDGATAATYRVVLDVLSATLPEPSGFHCYLNILVDPSSVARFQNLPLWGEQHWQRLERYVADLAAHGQRTITAFIVDDPWNSATGFPVRNMIEWRFAGEWTTGAPAGMSFDFSTFDRFVAMCMKAGINDHIESWSPLVQPGTDHSIVTYTDTRGGQRRKITLPAGSPEYKAVWGEFARAFRDHLRQKGWLEKTYLAFDEIETDVLDRVVPFFHDTVPDLKLMISGGDEKGRHMAESPELAFHYGYYSPGSGLERPDIPARRKAGKRTLLYTATTPIYPNTFIFSDPLESRYLGWAIWKWDFDGYIRWAWNFWPATLWDQPFYTWPSGDMFLVYPGPDGPVDSMRWEMLREGIEDYECLWMAREAIRKRRATDAALAERAAKDLDHAVDLATQQFDRTRIPHDPIPARIDEARAIVNKLLVELDVP
ncbi:MAG TPA: glycoside hydrolase domain-containing protein [Bryobacteraceae bacterium]|nr:glycoside hydrolase domain-containing protein [Bryobacteraceae bacterium]